MTRILIVDGDPSMLDAVATALQRPHRTVATASNGEEALFLLSSFVPQLVITDVCMPRMNGWELVDALRSYPETSQVSVIFLTASDAAEDRLRALRLGAVDFLAKSCALEELELRVENALHASAITRRVSEIPAQSGLAGNLTAMPLASVLGLLATDRKSGELRVALGGEEAQMLLRDGAIVRARFARKGAVRGVACVLHVLQWNEGRFGFIEHEVVESDEVRMSTMALLMEAARLHDEARRSHAEAS